MSFPGGLAVIEVTGLNVRDFSGAPLDGYVVFTASEPVADPDADLVVFGSAMSQVTAGVMIPVTIPATDSVSPAFTYTIRLRLEGQDGDPPAWPGISVPSALGASVDLSALLAPS